MYKCNIIYVYGYSVFIDLAPTTSYYKRIQFPRRGLHSSDNGSAVHGSRRAAIDTQRERDTERESARVSNNNNNTGKERRRLLGGKGPT